MTQNTIPGTARKAHTSRSGVYLERGYVYLTPTHWAALYALSGALSISVSEYLASIIPTDNGTAEKDLNDSPSIRPRNT